jgi:tetratricopeptide (TPR) repeat protein
MFLLILAALVSSLVAAEERASVAISGTEAQSLKPEALGQVRAGEQLLAKAVFHMQKATELDPKAANAMEGDLPADLKPEALEHVQKARQFQAQALTHYEKAVELDPKLATADAPEEPPTRTAKGAVASKGTAKDAATEKDDAYEKHKPLTSNAKKGAGLLTRALKVLEKVPVVKNFIPKGASGTADAAKKVGEKVSGDKDGFIIDDNGDLREWDPKTKDYKKVND